MRSRLQSGIAPDWSNPLNRSLAFLYNAGCTPGYPVNLVDGKLATSGTAQPGYSVLGGYSGSSYTAGSQNYLFGSKYNTSGARTFCFLQWDLTTSLSASNWRFGIGVNAWASGDAGLKYSSTNIRAVGHNGTSQVTAVGSAISTWVGKPVLVTAVLDGTNLLLYENARNTASTACALSGPSAADLHLGEAADGAVTGPAYSMPMAAYWQRALSAYEIAALAENPWQLFLASPRRRGVSAPSGALSGTAALVFGQTGALKGAGVLAGTSALTFAQTGALTGAGALAGSSALTFAQSATLTAAGALVGSSALVFGQSATLAATGILAGSSALAFGQTGTLTAAGILAGASALTFAQTAALAGAGALAGSSALTFGASATADVPSGALSGTSSLSFGGSATLLASGFLAGASTISFDAFATLDQPSNAKAGPVDQRMAEGWRRKKRKKLPLELQPAAEVLERAPPAAVIAQAQTFQSLADLTGQPLEALRADVDHDIELLMREAAERDDEEALLLILTALD